MNILKHSRLGLIALLLACGTPLAMAETHFTAAEYAATWGSWDTGSFALFDGAYDFSPDASGNADVSSGAAMYWELVYDGAGLLTYSWGESSSDLDDSIQFDIGTVSFDYLSVATVTKGNGKPSAVVSNLILETDMGVLNGPDLSSNSPDASSYMFNFGEVQSFGAFTLSGETTFTWKGKGSNASALAVIVTGGMDSPVVPEPMSISMLLAGLAALTVRSVYARRPAKAAATPA
ncbi:MAG: hypothetical protein HUU46_04720 [Candidatus Hydrogenedentes bacterium]|nr:hypothetical protein [Candidatus Hydrogenedentota bacterium]